MAGTELRVAREESGLSIRELSERAGVAASTVWRIESGRLDPTVGMLRRLIEATGSTPRPAVSTRESAVSLALGRRAAAEVLLDPGELVARARARVDAMLGAGGPPPGARRWAAEWQRILDGPLEGVVEALIDPGERGYELRQNMPFTGVLTDDERLAVVRLASSEWRAMRSA